MITFKFSAKIIIMPKGFTLIEVLVAITIVGIVFGVIITSGSALQRNSRDTQREVDLRNLQSALQQYYADQNYYPASLTLSTPNPLKSPDNTKTYINVTPTDPQIGNSQYCYSAQATRSILTGCDNSSTKCHYYLLCAAQEATSSGQPPSVDCQASCGAAYNLQVTPIQ